MTQGWTLCQNTSSGRFGGSLRTTVLRRSIVPDVWTFPLLPLSRSRSFFEGEGLRIIPVDIPDCQWWPKESKGMKFEQSPLLPVPHSEIHRRYPAEFKTLFINLKKSCMFFPTLLHISIPVLVNASVFLGSPGKLSLYHSFQSLSISL